MKFSFSNKIFFFLVATLVVFGMISGYQFHQLNRKVQSNIGNAVLADVKSLGYVVASQFGERVGDAETFTFNPVLLQNDRIKISDTLDSYSASYGIYDLILILDTDGNVIGSNQKSPSGKKLLLEGHSFPNFKLQSWFQEALKGEKTVVSEPLNDTWIGKIYGDSRSHNVFARLIKDSWGRPYRLIANFANLSWIQNEIDSFNSRLAENGFSSAVTFFTSGSGQVITAMGVSKDPVDLDVFTSDLSSVLSGGANVMTTQSHLYAFAPILHTKFHQNLGWGLGVRIPQSEVSAGSAIGSTRFFATMFACVFGLGMIGFFFSRRIGKRLCESIQTMNAALSANHDTGKILVKASQELEDASSKQSSAIQESMSALAEMASMISQTAENAKLSQEATREVSDRSVGGRQIMGKMSDSMSEIEQTNQSLQEISKSIESISQKTKVINDIVFKTQLLSFNASIEAARAGQYGKGFVVVAEEISNLAQMSGNALREIESLILDSERKVDTTLDLIRRRVNEGNVVTEEAVRTFNGISSAIDSLREQVKLIAEACVQQDVGIQQTNKAMEKLDLAARQTLDAAQMTRTSSDKLQGSGDHLSLLSKNFMVFVSGSSQKDFSQVSEPLQAGFADPEKLEPTFELNPSEDKPFNFDDLVEEHPQLENIDLTKVSPDDDSFKKIAS